MRIFSVCLLFFLLVVSTPSLLTTRIYAHEVYNIAQVGEGQINEAIQNIVPLRFLPGNSLYLLIVIKENIERFFQPSAVKKAYFDQVLAGKRIKETYLLLSQNDAKRTSKNLESYSSRLDKMVEELARAKGQKQDVATLAMQIAEGLRNQETLLWATRQKWDKQQDGYNFDQNFGKAALSLTQAILAINDVRPGLKDRFKTATISANLQETTPSPQLMPIDERISPYPSANPKRIIY